MKAAPIAICNSSEEIIEALQLALAEEGYSSVGGHVVSFKKGESDFIKFVKDNKPQAIIYDIAPPYDKNWTFLRLIKNVKEVEKIPFVVTTTNKAQLEELVGETPALELVGKPFDLKEIVSAVKRALASKKDQPQSS